MEERLERSRTSAGFTLSELVIARVVVGILTAIRYPLRPDRECKARRGAAQVLLIERVRRQQQYLLKARSCAAVLLREIECANELRDAGVT